MAIAAAGGDPVQPVQLQKSLFLLGRKLPTLVGSDFYRFKPYNYGPFCQAVYEDAESLASDGLINILPSPAGRWRQFSATRLGVQRAQTLRSTGQVPAKAVAYLERAVAWTRSLSFNELIRSIYTHFPEYKANSVFQPV